MTQKTIRGIKAVNPSQAVAKAADKAKMRGYKVKNIDYKERQKTWTVTLCKGKK